jgi:hypothetical protein
MLVYKKTRLGLADDATAEETPVGLVCVAIDGGKDRKTMFKKSVPGTKLRKGDPLRVKDRELTMVVFYYICIFYSY